ncbi:breast cancer type 1 susceptibility protein isoform X2 [Patagioenas fasciata]|uniref:breast cancer type 1 susceptibility protein isoform X2 n=1 Tax=Patagioenas fasciata TaxID=372321 RepID=UPI003A991AC7
MRRMDLSVIGIGDVQNVLLAMQKNLECPICLDVVKEPVSTKCDHIFCRFCMFQLLSKKKKGVIQCPLCKTEVTKRSLKENSRFKQLIEGLLEIIHAFELDTGVKFLNSHHVPKTSTEATAAELLCKERSVVQSKGFRNRKKSATGNGQENRTLEAHVDAPLADTGGKRCSLRNKKQKCDSEKGIYIELGSDSSEELFKQANNAGRLQDKEALWISSQENTEELKSAEKGNEYPCTTQPDKLGAEEVIPPNVIGASDFSKEGSSKESTRSITGYAKPAQGNVSEYQSSPLNVLPAELTEQCDSPPRNGDMSFFKNTEEMDVEQTLCDSNSEEFDFKESRLDKSKEVDIAQSVKAAGMDEPENDSLNDKELPLEKLLQAEALDCAALNQVSRKRLKRSIQKVNEWFSKSEEIPSQDDSAEATDVSGEGDASLSDKESRVSQQTDPMVDSKEIVVAEGNKKWSKETAESIKDKIFGKTYKRERKSNPPFVFRDVLPTEKKEDAAADKSWNNSSKDRPKRRRKTVSVLRPEDFIKKKDAEEADGCPEHVDFHLGDAEKKRCEESSAVGESRLSENKEDDTVAEVEEGGSRWKKAAEKVAGKLCDTEPDLNISDQKGTKQNGSAAKRSRRSTRTMCALQLVVDRNSLSPDAAEPQIDSYPSSEEPRKADSEQRQVRRSRHLQLLSEEMAKEMGKGVIKGAKKHESDPEGSFPGVQRNVLVHASECEEQREPRDVVSDQALTDPEGGDLEANEMQISLKNSLDAAGTGKILNATSGRQHSNCGSLAPDTASQESEIRGSPLLLEPPSTASPLPEETSESPAALPQGSRHDTLKVPGDLRAEKLPVAKNGLEVTEEVEDSELDTQYLRNIFRHSKRLSFSLYPTPVKARAIGDAASETLKRSCADQGEDKRSKYLKTESLQEERAESLSRACGKEPRKAKESCVSPVTCFVGDTECAQAEDHRDVSQAEDHREDVSQVANQGNPTPIGMGTARTEGKDRLQKGEQENEKAVSTDIGIGSELRQNPVKSKRSQSDQDDAEEQVFKRAGLNTVDEMCGSSESDQAGRAEGVVGKAPLLHFQYKSMICPVTCQQRPAELSSEGTGRKRSKREREQVKGDEEAATQTAGTRMPEGLVAQALEEPVKGNGDLTGSSETPDGLLCSDDDIEENTSFSETDRRERSAVFVKSSNNAPVQELHNHNVSSKPTSRGIPRSRRRARKLQSSDEESSEDEELPCFQSLINSKSASTPLQTSKQVPSVVESSVSPIALPPRGSNGDNNAQKTPGAAPSSGCVSPSQESECSVNLFSSQSNTSEESVDGAQELKKLSVHVHPSKQVDEGKETSPSCNWGRKRSKTNSRGECQEDQNMGANPGEASGSDSETSNVEDSCGPFSQGEILTTQQKNIMQNNLKKLQQEMAALEAVLEQHGSQDCQLLPVHRDLPRSSSEGTLAMEQMRREREDTDEQNSGTRLNSASVLPNTSGNVTRSPSKSSSVRVLNPPAAEETTSCVAAPNAGNSCTQECKSTRSSCFPTSVLHNATGKENAASPVGTNRKEMSIVASGLTQSEHVVVQKFARKTGSTLSNRITEGTTHVIMKTDKELVCERTLKYFLGIAGRKWVVSYQWVIQSFKEGRILDEESFEVRGDVINGRNHQGPRRARQALTAKIFKDFEICCYGPFTDMTTEHLEWMVELCGASVVKQPHLFTHTRSSTVVVVVQPDAWMEDADYGAIQQKANVAMVTREWVLDSVACYKCQELDAYLVS